MTLPAGVIRTPMGVYVLQEDLLLSRWVEQANALDLPSNLREIASFAKYIPEGGVAIDAGACIGDHTITYSQLVGSRGHVYAFEPHPVSFEALRLNMARLTNVQVYPMALMDDNQVSNMQCDPSNIGASFMTQDGGTPVPCVSLDRFLLPHLTQCDFIHLDAEGYEPRILRGAGNLLLMYRPVMVIEVCDKHLRRAGSSEEELLSLIATFGYDVHPIPEHTEPELRDVLCLPRTL